MSKKINFKDWLKVWDKSKVHKSNYSDIDVQVKEYYDSLEALNSIVEEYVDNELLSEKLNLNTKLINLLYRNGIYRINQHPRKIYAKNHFVPLKDRVPVEDQLCDDWEEWDEDGCDENSVTA